MSWPEPFGNRTRQGASACVVQQLFPPLTGPARLFVPLGLLSAMDDAMIHEAAQAWTRVLARYTSTVTLTVVRALNEGTGQLYMVEYDADLPVAGRVTREPPKVRFNPSLYLFDTYDYRLLLMLHELGHVIGLAEANSSGCFRDNTVMAPGYYGGFVRHATAPTENDRARVRQMYAPQ